MRTLDRYMVRSFFLNYFVSLFVLISLYVVLDLFLNFDEFTESKKSTFWVICDAANYYFFNLPLYFSQLSGVITLFASCLTLAKMQRTNELTAVLASGTSLYRLAAPVVLSGLLMNVLVVADFELLLPRVAPKLARSRDDVEGSRVYDNLWFVRDHDNLISAQRFRPSDGRMRDMYVIELAREGDGPGRLNDVIIADKAEWDGAGKGWKLINGRRYNVAGDDVHPKPTRVDFYETELSPEDLVFRKMAAWNQFLSTRQLNQLVQRGDVRSESIAQIKHTRFTLPINNMILLMLGLSFFLNRLPGSVLTSGAKAVGVCAAAFLVSFTGQQLVGAFSWSHAASLPVWATILPAWVPLFLFGPLAAVLWYDIKT